MSGVAADYFNPGARISRSVFWKRNIVLMLIALVAAFLESFSMAILNMTALIMFLVLAYCSVIISIKRLHDLDKSGWFFLVTLIPVVGFLIWVIWLGCVEGTHGENRFGFDPIHRRLKSNEAAE